MKSRIIIDDESTFKGVLGRMAFYLLVGGVFGYVAAIQASGILRLLFLLSIFCLWVYVMTIVVKTKSKRLCYLEVVAGEFFIHAKTFDRNRIYGPHDFGKVEVKILQISKNSIETLHSEFELKLNDHRFYMSQEQMIWVLLFLIESDISVAGVGKAAKELERGLHKDLTHSSVRLSLMAGIN